MTSGSDQYRPQFDPIDSGEAVALNRRLFELVSQLAQAEKTLRDIEAVVAPDHRPPTGDETIPIMDAGAELRLDIRQLKKQIWEHTGALSRYNRLLKREGLELMGRLKRRTQALEVSEALFRSVFEDSILGIALLDGSGSIVDANPALQEILGYSAEQLMNMNLADDRIFQNAGLVHSLIESLNSGTRKFVQKEERFINGQGDERWGQLILSSIDPKRDLPTHQIIATLLDISEKKADQEALIRSERLSIAGQIGASLAHEINNPIQSVIGCLGLAEELLENDGKIREYMEVAIEELERTAVIVHRLRDLSRISDPIKKQLVDLNALLDRTLFLTAQKFKEHVIDVEWNPDPNLPLVMISPDHMKQVFLNLVLNALDAMPEGGRLTVTTSYLGYPKGVRITFADVGDGIDPNLLANLFEPFHSGRKEGLGLGLYVSKRIVEAHDGDISLESSPGEGTVFTILLPVPETA